MSRKLLCYAVCPVPLRHHPPPAPRRGQTSGGLVPSLRVTYRSHRLPAVDSGGLQTPCTSGTVRSLLAAAADAGPGAPALGSAPPPRTDAMVSVGPRAVGRGTPTGGPRSCTPGGGVDEGTEGWGALWGPPRRGLEEHPGVTPHGAQGRWGQGDALGAGQGTSHVVGGVGGRMGRLSPLGTGWAGGGDTPSGMGVGWAGTVGEHPWTRRARLG